MAPNDTPSGDDATLFPTERDHGSARQEADASSAQGAPAADAPAARRRAPRRSTKKATTIEPSAEPAEASGISGTDEGSEPTETKRPARKRRPIAVASCEEPTS